MKYLITFLLFSYLTTSLFAQTGNFMAEPQKSQLTWHAEKVTGEHDGTVALKSGNLELTDGKLSGGSFEIDMTSIACTDLENPEYNKKLVTHLKSDDFFAVQQFPVANLKIKNSIYQGKDRYKIVADMTIKGITKEVKFNAYVNTSGGMITAKADITIDRSEFNVRYGSGSFFDNLGDKTIYDEFQMGVTVVAPAKGQ